MFVRRNAKLVAHKTVVKHAAELLVDLEYARLLLVVLRVGNRQANRGEFVGVEVRRNVVPSSKSQEGLVALLHNGPDALHHLVADAVVHVCLGVRTLITPVARLRLTGKADRDLGVAQVDDVAEDGNLARSRNVLELDLHVLGKEREGVALEVAHVGDHVNLLLLAGPDVVVAEQVGVAVVRVELAPVERVAVLQVPPRQAGPERPSHLVLPFARSIGEH